MRNYYYRNGNSICFLWENKTAETADGPIEAKADSASVKIKTRGKFT